jgi:hypothetical protein
VNDNIPFEALSDRQKRMIEMRLRVNEDPELARLPLNWIARDRRGYALYKDKWAFMNGWMNRESAWDIDCMPIADFGNVNAAGALTIRSGFNTFPLTNPAHLVGSLDPEPFEAPYTTLTAITGDRQVGTSTTNLVVLLGCYVVHITGAGAVYQPATTTFNLRVISASGATGGAFTTLATLVVNTAANFVDVVPVVATTGRTITITGFTPNTAIAGIYVGDSLFGEMVMGAAVNHQGSILYAMLELC